ncbi:phosphoribosyl-ATP diphosphatase [Thalassospira alkalitolerans]|uniref:phosphoribosyl-ATP diphosphatase n=1 Tax=Thalassospira alkalitolerans TaxID=1293890 RepID=UPI003AA8C522
MTKTLEGDILDRLYTVIASRKGSDPEESYTAKLFNKGTAKIAQKVGEESVETVIAALAESPENVASESADLLYHLMVLWADRGVEPSDVWAALAKRQGISGNVEKAARTNK